MDESLGSNCVRGFFSYLIAERVFGELEPDKTYYYRIGYCPADRWGDLFVGRTLFAPGMRGTPEEQRYRRTSRKPVEIAQRMDHCGDNELSYRRLVETRDFTLLKWFHDNGVPQVVSFDHKVFERY